MMRNKCLCYYVLPAVMAFFFLGCKKDDSNELKEIMWTETFEGNFRYIGISKEKEVIAVKMNAGNTKPVEIFYKNNNNPALHIWLNNDGLPAKAIVDNVAMLFSNIRQGYIDVGVLYQGQISVFRDIEFDHEFMTHNLDYLKGASDISNILSWVGVVVDGVGCIGGIAGAKFTGGASLILSKLTCKGFISGITKKTVVKLVNNEEFTNGMNTWDTMEIIASMEPPSIGGFISGIGTIIWAYNQFANNNQENLNLIEGILQGGHGDIQVTLTWNSVCDLDLWVTDPYGETIKWNNPNVSSGGYLDFDNTYGYGPENVFWPNGGAPIGTYQVRVDYYSGSGTSTYSILIIVGDNVLNNGRPYTGQISPNQTVTVANFTYGNKSEPIIINNTVETTKPGETKTPKN